MKPIKKLTNKQQMFVKEYCVDMNGSAAMRRAGYTSKNTDVDACKLLVTPSIKAMVDKDLEKRVNKIDLTAEFVLNGIRAIAISGAKEGDKLRAYELLGKYLKLFVDRQETEITAATISTSKIDFSRFTVDELKDILASAN